MSSKQSQFELVDFAEIRNDRPKVMAVDSSFLRSPPTDSEFICSQWLQNSPGKFEAFQRCYRGLVGDGIPVGRVVDIGGGLNHITEHLLESREYVLVDPIHHLSTGEKKLLTRLGGDWLLKQDWADSNFNNCDMIVANDLFPNVDFRIGKFLRTVHNSNAFGLRMVLTLHHDERALHVKRDETGESLTVIPLPVREVVRELELFAPNVDFRQLLARPNHQSGWRNGRYMYFLQFQRQLTRVWGSLECGGL